MKGGSTRSRLRDVLDPVQRSAPFGGQRDSQFKLTKLAGNRAAEELFTIPNETIRMFSAPYEVDKVEGRIVCQ